MFKTLAPYLTLYKHYFGWLLLGLLLSITTLLATIGLLTLSGWFLAASAIAGSIGFVTFNYLLPAAFVRGFAISRTASRYFERIVTHEATFRLLARIRVMIFAAIFPRHTRLYHSYRQADLLNRLITDVETLDNLYLRVITPLISAIVVIGSLTCILGYFNFPLALMIGSILSFILVTFPMLFYHLAKPVGARIVELRSMYRESLNRLLGGQTILLIYNQWVFGINDLAQIESDKMKEEAKQSYLNQMSNALILIIAGLTICLSIYFSGAWVIDSATEVVLQQPTENALFNVATYGNEVIFSALAALFIFATLGAFEMLIPVSQSFSHLGLVIASANRLNQMITSSPMVTFSQTSNRTLKEMQDSSICPLSIDQLTFMYPNQIEAVLENVSLTFEPNEKIAIMGATGSGKSTLLQLLTRNYGINLGTILLFGRPIESFSESELRRLLSVVPQKIYLFNDTLRDNLVFKVLPTTSTDDQQLPPNASALEVDDGRLEYILKQVGLERLLEGAGLNQMMGDGGRLLSGGELRRIGIARALIHDAPIWLLDEPTEGLDALTEQTILDLIFEVTQNKTVLMVTHRQTDLIKFNRVMVMDQKELKQRTITADSLLN